MPVQALGWDLGAAAQLPVSSPAVTGVCVPVAQAVWQHIKVSTGKSEVSCIRRNNFTLLAHVAGCEINCSGKKKSKHLGIIMDTSSRTSALYRALGWKRKEISSPAQMISGFPGALGWIMFVRPSFHASVHLWTQLTDNRWHELAAWNSVAFPVHFVTCRSNS